MAEAPGATATCRCGRSIRLGPGWAGRHPGESWPPYWYHPASSTIWCDGWGDPDGTGRQAQPEKAAPVIRRRGPGNPGAPNA